MTCKAIPGSCGCPVLSDKSYEFVSDPVKFIESRIKQHSSRIFQNRVLNNPTVFVCSAPLVSELLVGERACDFEHGYRSVLHRVYGDLILFENEVDANHLRQLLVPVFNNYHVYQQQSKKIWTSTIKSFEDRCIGTTGIPVYSEFKALMTKVCLELFLNLDETSSNDLIDEITDLSTKHWHGIISVPVSINVPLSGHQSTFSLAVESKDKLLFEIRSILLRHYSEENKGETLFDALRKLSFPKENDLEQHLLLFVSALIPKAFSSLITSFLIAMAGDAKIESRVRARRDSEYLEHILLEVERLWPPLFAGRRLAKCATNLGPHKVPKDYALIYVTHAAHRDPTVFPDPEKFNPDRWSTCNKDDKNKVFTFGAGFRCCIGTKFIRSILLDVMHQLLQNYDWDLYPHDQDVTYKYLPVARPCEEINIQFHPVVQ